MSDSALGGWVVFCVIAAVLAGLGFWIADGIERNKVSDCLQTAPNTRQDHVYMTDVESVEAWRRYPNGEATWIVEYRVSYSDQVKSVYCRW
ncbi:MAG: hypothetical protein AAGA12_02840 [Pseudomonadota bacterium]